MSDKLQMPPEVCKAILDERTRNDRKHDLDLRIARAIPGCEELATALFAAAEAGRTDGRVTNTSRVPPLFVEQAIGLATSKGVRTEVLARLEEADG